MKKGRKPKMIIDGKLKCCICKKVLLISNFNKDCRAESGFRSYCKACQKRYQWKPIISKWYSNQKKRCIYCGYSEEKDSNEVFKVWKMNKLQIDRKDNQRNYQKDNMVIACPLCNFIKGDYFSYKEMLEIGKVIRKIREERKKRA